MNIYTQIHIQNHAGYFYTAEDTHLDVGGEGFTVSYWEGTERVNNICMDKEEALALANAIYKLYKN